MKAEGFQEANRMRKNYTADFKAKVALEAVKGDRSLAELASRYEVHSTQIGQWRKALVAGLPEIFSERRHRKERDTEEEKARLYEEIGRLKVELDWLKKRV
jgi:putative transposase